MVRRLVLMALALLMLVQVASADEMVREVSIGGSTENLTDYQVKLEISYYPEMQEDFSDIWFACANGTELNYWIESYTVSTQATVWVKVPYIPTEGTTIYMVYGDPTATPESNGEATFEFFDDFNGDALDTDKWDNSEGASVSVSGGYLTISGTGADKEVFTTSTHPYNTAIRTKAKWSTFAEKYGWFGYGVSGDADHIQVLPAYYSSGAGLEGYTSFKKSGTYSPSQSLSLSSSQVVNYQIWEVQRLSTDEVEVIREGTTELDYTDTAYIPTISLNGYIGIHTSGLSGYYDYFLIRKCVATEPTGTVGDVVEKPWGTTPPPTAPTPPQISTNLWDSWMQVFGSSLLAAIGIVGVLAFMCMMAGMDLGTSTVVMLPTIWGISTCGHFPTWFKAAIIMSIGLLWGLVLLRTTRGA